MHGVQAATTKKYEAWREEMLSREAEEARLPRWRRLRADLGKRLAVALGVAVLLMSLLLLLPALQISYHRLIEQASRAQIERAALQCTDSLAAKELEIAEIKRAIRGWHAKSKAWGLEPLPPSFRPVLSG